MQFDLFDKKIKEAAENHHPAYDEKAWTKMEKLLEKHLPQNKDDRRRIFFFLLLFLLLVGGSIIYLLIDKPWKNNKTLVERKTEQNAPVTPSENKFSKQETITKPENKQESTTNEENKVILNNVEQQKLPGTDEQKIISGMKDLQTKKFIPGNNNIIADKQKNNDIAVKTPDNDQLSSVLDKGDVTKKNNTDTKPKTEEIIVKADEQKIAGDKNISENKVNDINKKDETNKETTKVDQPQKKNVAKNKKESPFAFSLSAGPDVSKAGSSSLSKISFSYGAGVSFTFKKFTLRTGFYVASKIYSASPKDYKLEYVLPSNIKLLNVDANCKVYEIPLSLAYNFANNKNSNWYGAIGLSSYLMKEEKYNNLYKNTNTNQTYYRTFDYNNQNKHYFSVLDLSAGYTYKLNKTFSLSAEPYVRIPLQGIGEGKVNLNSAGVLFSLGIKPFNHKKNK